MGSKPPKPAIPMRLTRAATFMQSLHEKDCLTNEEGGPYFNRDGEMVESSHRMLYSPRYPSERYKRKEERLKEEKVVALIDVQTLKSKIRSRTPMSISRKHSTPSKPVTPSPIASKVLPTPASTPIPVCFSATHFLSIPEEKSQSKEVDISDLKKPAGVFLSAGRLDCRRTETHQAKKSKYKLIRSARGTKSWDITPYDIPSQQTADHMLTLLREAAQDPEGLSKPKPPLKQIKSTSTTNILTKGPEQKKPKILTFKEFYAEDNPGLKTVYSIRKHASMKVAEKTEVRLVKEDRLKSRAERTWIWKGRRGSASDGVDLAKKK